MVHFTRILAVLALLAVSVTAETVQHPAPSTTSISIEHHARALASAAGSAGSAAGGSTAVVGGEIPAENAPIVAQWTAAKVLLEKAFAGETSLETKLAAFETEVDATLRGGVVTFDEAKKVIGEFLTPLESDQLTPIKNALGVSSTATAGSAGSSSDGGNTVGSAGSSASSTVSTPAPTTSAAVPSSLVSAAVPASVAIAVAAFASL